MNLQYNSDNYIDLLHAIAGRMQVPVVDNTFHLSARYGQGFVRAFNISYGISVMLGDVTPLEDFMLERLPASTSFYSLQFSEVIEEKQAAALPDKASIYLNNSFVVLTNAQMEARYVVPVGIRLRFVVMIFERKHLLQYFQEPVVDQFLSSYFSQQVQKAHIVPIDADYRSLLDEVIQAEITHPLATNYMATRCMLLMERFIIRFMQKTEKEPQVASKLSADEINRLMRVESRLVKDYSQQPPTIEVLSRAAAMSPTKLKKDFKQLYGSPIYEYYQKNRMKKAHALLAEGNYSIKEVGSMVGYTNLSHFAVSFKKEFGVLPSELSNRDEMLPMGE